MRYLTIIPDYTKFCIQDDFNEQIKIEELHLPENYIKEVTSWHARYRSIIPLDDNERQKQKLEIERLDKQGLELSKKLQQLVPGGAKVKYFSEGLLKYLPV